jgi:hypothetical protein
MNINKKVLDDLEIDIKILPKIDHTITSYGSESFRSMFRTYYSDYSLNARQQIIKNIINDHTCRKSITSRLKKIKKLEQDIVWLFDDDVIIDTKQNAISVTNYNDLYYKTNALNKNRLLSFSNFMKVFNPSMLIIIYLIIYFVLRYRGIQIDIVQYFKNMYNGYRMLIRGFLYLMIENDNMVSLLGNCMTMLYVFYQLYITFSMCDTSLTHYRKCRTFRESFTNIKQFVINSKQIFNRDKYVNQSMNHDMIQKSINVLDKHFGQTLSLGSMLMLKKDINELQLKEHFKIVQEYLGKIDVMIGVSKLVMKGGFTFPKYDFISTEPYVRTNDLWSLYIDNAVDQVINDCDLGHSVPSTMILTGPNTSGKSTYIRNIMLTVLMAQCLGISPCSSIEFTPFTNLFTYLDIPNISRNRESLFEAEAHRCLEFCKILENMPPHKFSFTIMDELFTGTNPIEGAAGSYSICEYLGKFTNSIMIVTTHFNKLTELAKDPEKFINKKFYIERLPGDNFYRPYKIVNGVSDQNIAIDLLKTKGYNSIIIDRANELIKNIE